MLNRILCLSLALSSIQAVSVRLYKEEEKKTQKQQYQTRVVSSV